jgi:hypothetical protein
MRITTFACIVLTSLVFAAVPGRAMETDQYSLPPAPLADISDEVTQYVRDHIFEAAAHLNADIAAHEACLAPRTLPSVSHCTSSGAERKKLAELRSADALAKAVYKLLGDGTIFTTRTGDWLTTHDFEHTPARYKADFTDSIYVTMPVNYATLSPTVKVNGVEFGTDKFDHFFQQGYRYYKIYSAEIAKHKTPEQAANKAVSWGKMTERTIYGYLVSGVYSNADLFANYAGMKFYLNLTQPVTIGTETRPALLTLADGRWQIADASASSEMLKPFVAEQMNEALNPSGYSLIVYPTVLSVVKKHDCEEWKQAFPALTAGDFAGRSKSLELWNGEDYGFTRSKKMVTIADTCFGG